MTNKMGFVDQLVNQERFFVFLAKHVAGLVACITNHSYFNKRLSFLECADGSHSVFF